MEEVAIIGVDTGETVVIPCDIINRELRTFLVRLTTDNDRPVDSDGRTWIPSAASLESMLNAAPNLVQLDFLSALHEFLEDLYNPAKFIRPGTVVWADTSFEQEELVGRCVVAYFRHTRVMPMFTRADMFDFAFDFLCTL